VYDKTCDWTDFMTKNDGGFNNYHLCDIDNIVINDDDYDANIDIDNE
jgi:hypothetical protein